MPRIRSIKPETWDDETIGSMSLLARLTFYGLISLADDDGRGRSGAKLLRSRLHAHAPDVRLRDMEAALVELARSCRVVFYESGNEKYYWVRNFDRHQVIKKRTPSSLPPPPSSPTGSPPVPPSSPTSGPPVTPGMEGSGVDMEGSGVERSRSGAERNGSPSSTSAPSASATAPAPGADGEHGGDPEPERPHQTMAEIRAELGLPNDDPQPPHRFPAHEELERRRAELREQAKRIEGGEL